MRAVWTSAPESFENSTAEIVSALAHWINMSPVPAPSFQNTTVALASALLTECNHLASHRVQADLGLGTQDATRMLFKLAVAVVTAIAAFCVMCGFHRCCKGIEVREFCGIGTFFRLIGYDKFDAFELVIVVHGVKYAGRENISSCVRIKAGQNSVSTQEFKVGTGDAIQETLRLKIKPSVHHVVIEAVDQADNFLQRDCLLASGKLPIADVMKYAAESEAQLIKLRRAKTKKKSMTCDPEVSLTFTRDDDSDDGASGILEGIDVDSLSMETQLKLQKAAKERHKDKEGATDSGADSSQHIDRLSLLASACEGPLLMASSHFGGGHNTYFFAVWQDWRKIPKSNNPYSKATLMSWSLAWWPDKAKFDMRNSKADCHPISSMRMLKVCNVFPVSSMPNEFCVRYQDADKQRKEIFVSRVDRSRDTWVESLHLFVEQLRKMRSEMMQIRKHGHAGEEPQKKSEGRRTHKNHPSSVIRAPTSGPETEEDLDTESAEMEPSYRDHKGRPSS